MKKILIMAVIALLALAPLCPAEVSIRDDGTRVGVAVDLNVKGPTTSRAGTIITLDFSDKSADVELNLRSFFGVDLAEITAVDGASPYYVVVAGGADYINFPGEEAQTTQSGSPIEYTFKVPADYNTSSTQAAMFIIACQNSTVDLGGGESTPNYIDWDIVVNSSGSAVSTTRYDQTPVALTSTTNFQNVTLTYATPGDITAGDTVTVRIWRVYEALASSTGRNATSDLRVFSVAFQYTVEW